MDRPLPSLESLKTAADGATTFIDLTLSDDDDFEVVETPSAKATEQAVKNEPSEHCSQSAHLREEKTRSETAAQADTIQVLAARASIFHSTENQISGEDLQSTPRQPHEEEPLNQLQMLQDFIANHTNDMAKAAADGNIADMAEYASDEEDANASAAFQEQQRNYEAKKKGEGPT